MNNTFNKVELYIDNQLEGEELKNFEKTLQTDQNLQKEVEVYQTMIAAIRTKEADKLRQKFAVLDVVLDKQFEEEEMTAALKKQGIQPKIRSMVFRKSFVFKAAATFLVVFAAYTIFSYFTNSSTPQIAFEKYESEYTGWVKQNTPKETEKTESYASEDVIGEDTENTHLTKKKNNIKTSLSSPNQEGVASTNTPKTPSTSTNVNKIEPFDMEYENANFSFVRGDYNRAIEKLQQIADNNSSRKSFRLGMAYYYNQDLNDARVNLQESIKENSSMLPAADIATAKWFLAMTHAKQDDMNTAKSYFNELANGNNNYSKNAKEIIDNY
ncbi:MAG: tetratricopeptide repeat protein [Chitinophagales bacterium]